MHLFYALEQALSNILNEGVVNRYTDLRDKANMLRQGMLSLGLKFVINQKDMCSVLTTVYTPSHIDVGVLRHKLREKSIIIYEGKGCFKNRVFQVGNIGELSFTDIQYFLDSLEKILDSFESIVKILPGFELVRKTRIVGTRSQIPKLIPEIEKISADLLISEERL